jgi:uncharacterized membrane protein (Fun14 family)
LEQIIPDSNLVEWIVTLIIAFIVGLIAGKLLRTAIWLGILIIIIYILIQFVLITPSMTIESFFNEEKLAEIGKNFVEVVKNIIPHIEEHLLANTGALIALVLGFIVSFFIGKE